VELYIRPQGQVEAVYDEALPLEALGRLEIRRASAVEPGADGSWTADLAPVHGPVLGPYFRRSEALAAERVWLSERLAEVPSGVEQGEAQRGAGPTPARLGGGGDVQREP